MMAKLLNDSNKSNRNLFNDGDDDNLSDKTASVCTNCQEEMDDMEQFGQVGAFIEVSTGSNNFDRIFQSGVEKLVDNDTNQLLSEATKSLSRINLEFGSNQNNDTKERRNDQNLESICESCELNNGNAEDDNEEIVIEYVEYNQDFSAENVPVNNCKVLSDKAVQTDPQIQTETDVWDSEFPSGEELSEIAKKIKTIETKQKEKLKNKIKMINRDKEDGKMKMRKIVTSNYNSMSSILLNRRKRLAHLSNDIYQLSSYLDDIRKALSVKEPPITIPSPPEITGYDSQFDFPRENRFEKLPIVINSHKSKNKTFISSNSGSSSPRVGSSTVHKKRMADENNKCVSKRFKRQIESRNTIISDKENQHRGKTNCRSTDDSNSMYAYNPLSNRQIRNHKNN